VIKLVVKYLLLAAFAAPLFFKTTAVAGGSNNNQPPSWYAQYAYFSYLNRLYRASCSSISFASCDAQAVNEGLYCSQYCTTYQYPSPEFDECASACSNLQNMVRESCFNRVISCMGGVIDE
jgi:hypothetical protein